LTIKNNGTIDNFSVSVKSSFDHNPVDPTKVINRQWTISEAVVGGTSAIITFQFNSGEGASSFTTSGPVNIGHWNGSSWDAIAATLSGSGPYTITNNTSSPITSFSPFGVGNEGSLPVSLLYFNSFATGKIVNLKWKTAWELNNSGFEIERSGENKNNWVKIGFVQGHGTTNQANEYSFTDNNVSTGKYNYRLKQLDFNGNFEYFELNNITEIIKPGKFEISQNYPNPSNPKSLIDFQLPEDSKVTIQVYNLIGEEVTTLIDGNLTAGFYKAVFDGNNLASGVYIYRIIAQGQTQSFTKTMKMILVK
jgi:hypothetical protein